MTTTFNTSNADTVANQICAQLQAGTTSTNSFVSGFLNTAIGNSQNNTTTVNTYLQNLITSNSDTLINNSTVQSYCIVQNQTITILGTVNSTNCNFGQNVQLSLVMNAYSNAVISMVNADTTNATAIANAAAANDTANTGPIQELGALLSEPAVIIAIAVGAIILLYFIFKGHGNQNNNSGNGTKDNNRGNYRRYNDDTNEDYGYDNNNGGRSQNNNSNYNSNNNNNRMNNNNNNNNNNAISAH